MNKVYITNSQDKIEVTRALSGLVRRAVGQALKYEKVDFDAELSVTFVDNGAIKRLNSEYRNIDRETDVLSFPLYESGEIEIEDGERAALGDVVISLEKAEAQAIAAKLKDLVVKIPAKAGSNGRLFGAVTSKEVSDALKAQHNITIAKAKIVQDEPIKSFGAYQLKCKLGYEIVGNLKVEVVEG